MSGLKSNSHSTVAVVGAGITGLLIAQGLKKVSQPRIGRHF